MLYRFFKTLMCLAILGPFGSALALPIIGTVNLVAAGEFTEDVNGNATGFDFQALGGGQNNASHLGVYVSSTEDIDDMITAVGVAPTVEFFDFDFAALPATEWVLGQVELASGVIGNLIFEITSGQETDQSTTQAQIDDIGGGGKFKFVCTDAACSNPSFTYGANDTYEDTVGRWSLSGSGVVIMTNVPAPASVALLGLGLIGLGVIRNRRTSKKVIA